MKDYQPKQIITSNIYEFKNQGLTIMDEVNKN